MKTSFRQRRLPCVAPLRSITHALSYPPLPPTHTHPPHSTPTLPVCSRVCVRACAYVSVYVTSAPQHTRALAIALKLPFSSVRAGACSAWPPASAVGSVGGGGGGGGGTGTPSTLVEVDLLDLPASCDATALFGLVEEIAQV